MTRWDPELDRNGETLPYFFELLVRSSRNGTLAHGLRQCIRLGELALVPGQDCVPENAILRRARFECFVLLRQVCAVRYVVHGVVAWLLLRHGDYSTGFVGSHQRGLFICRL